MDDTNDAEIISLKLRVIEGDEVAFRTVFSFFRDRIFHYIFKITKSRESSEEIVMDVFIKLWEGRTMLAEIENMPSFIFRIARIWPIQIKQTESIQLPTAIGLLPSRYMTS